MKGKHISKRLLASTGDHIPDEELLEYLLRYCDPDPAQKSQELLETFGNLANLLDAQVEDLEATALLDKSSVALVRLVSELHRRYLLIRSRSDQYLKDHTAIAQYLMPLFAGEQQEVIYLLSLNSARMVLGCTRLAQGNVGQVNLSVRALVKDALQKNASCIVLAHNHPSGLASPSQSDIHTTFSLRDMLEPLDITLLDHIVFSNDSYLSMRECGYFRL